MKNILSRFASPTNFRAKASTEEHQLHCSGETNERQAQRQAAMQGDHYVKPSHKPLEKFSHPATKRLPQTRKFFCSHCNQLSHSSTPTASLLSGEYTSYIAQCCGKQVSVRNSSPTQSTI